jgi:Skp family chaperone for outer membrane proteins
MKLLIKGLAGATFAVLLAATPAFAQAPPPTPAIPMPSLSILVVDPGKIHRDAKVMISIRSQLEGLRQRFMTELKGEETQLMTSERDLQQQRATLAQDVFNQRAQEFQKRVITFQEKQQQRGGQIDGAQRNAMDQMRQRLFRIVEDTARRRNATMVVENTTMLYYDGGLDITDEVLRRLDQELPTLTVVVPQPAAGANAAPAAATGAQRRR